LATAKMDQYYPNPYFQLKLTLLALVGIHAWIFHRSVYGKTASAEGAPAKLAGALSLVLWIGILSMGRWIAYYEPPK
jgi:formate-dependent nitrite reductase membrane component NrfD